MGDRVRSELPAPLLNPGNTEYPATGDLIATAPYTDAGVPGGGGGHVCSSSSSPSPRPISMWKSLNGDASSESELIDGAYTQLDSSSSRSRFGESGNEESAGESAGTVAGGDCGAGRWRYAHWSPNLQVPRG